MKYGVNSKLSTNGPATRSMPSEGQWNGNVRAMLDQYTFEAGDASGVVIKVGQIMKGQRMIDCAIAAHTAPGASVTAKVGTQKKDGSADDDDRFITATAFAAADTIVRLNKPANGSQYVATEDLDIIVTIGGADPTAGRLFSFSGLLTGF